MKSRTVRNRTVCRSSAGAQGRLRVDALERDLDLDFGHVIGALRNICLTSLKQCNLRCIGASYRIEVKDKSRSNL